MKLTILEIDHLDMVISALSAVKVYHDMLPVLVLCMHLSQTPFIWHRVISRITHLLPGLLTPSSSPLDTAYWVFDAQYRLITSPAFPPRMHGCLHAFMPVSHLSFYHIYLSTTVYSLTVKLVSVWQHKSARLLVIRLLAMRITQFGVLSSWVSKFIKMK